MNNPVKCQELFTYESVLFKNLFSRFTHPWEIIPGLKAFIESVIREGLDGYERLFDNVLVGKNVKISDSARIDGPAIIGSGSEIRHGAFIRGSVILGAGCVVGNSSEVKNSVMMDGAQAPHFNYVGDSILGKTAHLGAGAICSNLRSDGKTVRIKDGLGDVIETNLRKLGAILGDGVEIGCGAVLCPGTIVGKSSTVYPLTVTRGVYPKDSIIKATDVIIPKFQS